MELFASWQEVSYVYTTISRSVVAEWVGRFIIVVFIVVVFIVVIFVVVVVVVVATAAVFFSGPYRLTSCFSRLAVSRASPGRIQMIFQFECQNTLLFTGWVLE